MSRPTPHQIGLLFAQLRAVPWSEYEARLNAAFARDNGPGTVPDGWPPGGQGGRPGGDTNRPTENAAIARVLGKQERDELHIALENAYGYLEQAAHSAGALLNRIQVAEALTQPEPRPDPAGTCNACQRWVPGTPDDRLRSGYCDACRKAWERAGHPDRAAFERDRRAMPTDAA